MDHNSDSYQIHIKKKTSSKHYCFILTNIYQNINKIESDFPPTSGQIRPTFGHSDWLNRDPHMVYRLVIAQGRGSHIGGGGSKFTPGKRGEGREKSCHTNRGAQKVLR